MRHGLIMTNQYNHDMTIKEFEELTAAYRLQGFSEPIEAVKKITPRAYNAFVREHKEYAERRGLTLT